MAWQQSRGVRSESRVCCCLEPVVRKEQRAAAAARNAQADRNSSFTRTAMITERAPSVHERRKRVLENGTISRTGELTVLRPAVCTPTKPKNRVHENAYGPQRTVYRAEFELFEYKCFYSIRSGNTVLAERSWKWGTRVTVERRRRSERKNTTDGRVSTNGADRPNECGNDDDGGGRGNTVVRHGRNFLRSIDLVSGRRSPTVVVRRRSIGRHHNAAAKATAVTRYDHRAQRGCGDRDSWAWYKHNGNGARRMRNGRNRTLASPLPGVR